MWQLVIVAVILIVMFLIALKAYSEGYNRGYTKGITDGVRDCEEKHKKIFNRINDDSDTGFRVRDKDSKPKLS